MIEVAVYAAEGSGAGLIQVGPDQLYDVLPGLPQAAFAVSDAAALCEAFWQLLPSATFDALIVAMAAKRADANRTWAA